MAQEALINQCEISFHSDYSYELLVDGPILLPEKPSIVPPLDLESLPQYESSEEEEEQTKHLDEGVKYIDSYY